jgi:hypothetical protein
MSSNFHGVPLKMELDGKIMTLDLQLHMHALRVTLRSLARHSPNGSHEWQLREWNSLKQRRLQKQNQLAMMTIADLQLSSTAPQRQHRLVCCQRWLSFATLPTDCSWGVNAAVPYCGCILIPLLPVGWLVGWSEIKVAGL